MLRLAKLWDRSSPKVLDLIQRIPNWENEVQLRHNDLIRANYDWVGVFYFSQWCLLPHYSLRLHGEKFYWQTDLFHWSKFYVNKAHQRKICIFCLISISMKKVSSVGKNQFIFFFFLWKIKADFLNLLPFSVLNVLDFFYLKKTRE